MDKILLITATGLTGQNISNIFKNKDQIVGTYYRIKESDYMHIDISDEKVSEDVFDNVNPDIVVLSAALTNVDYCQSHPKEAFEINVKGVENITKLCKTYGSKLVFFSSDYIFDGEYGPYSEEDNTNPINVYGETKLEGENMIINELQDYLVLRTTVVYGKEIQGKNFVIRLINDLEKGREVKIPNDQIGTPTYAFNLAELTKELISQKAKGVFNAAGSELIDRYNFALKVCEVFDLDKELIIPVSTKQSSQTAKRPLRAGLKTEKLKQVVATNIMGVVEGLEKLKYELNYEK